MELHPLCTLFPRMTGEAFDALVADIVINGLRQPIVVLDGMILDGGNRYRACVAAQVEPTTVEFEGGNIVSFVLSANLHRRHMTAGQQAAIVASAQDWAKAQPAHRPDNQTLNVGLSTRAERAAVAGASIPTQRDADRVVRSDAELGKSVAAGEISLTKALAQITGTARKAPTPKAPKSPATLAREQVDAEAAQRMEDAAEDTLKLLDDAQRKNDELIEELTALKADDGKAELAKQMELRRGLDRRVDVLTGQVHEMDKDLQRYVAYFKELRQVTGAASNRDAMAAIRIAFKTAA